MRSGEVEGRSRGTAQREGEKAQCEDAVCRMA